MPPLATFNAMHLGDNLVHLHFMRAMAKAYPDRTFTHGAPDQHLQQLAPLVWDLPNLTLTSIAHTPQGALNAWRGVEGHWYNHPQRHDFASYHLAWFDHLAARMDGGLRSPFTQPIDLLFDYPALQRKAPAEGSAKEGADWSFLLINSAPQSGQWHGHDPDAWARLAFSLERTGPVITTAPNGSRHIPCTQDFHMDVTRIGRISQNCKVIIGCPTGPLWTTLNVWNKDTVKLRIHLLDTERVEIAPNTTHANSLFIVPEILRERGLL